MDRLHAATIPVERAGRLFFDAAVPGVDDGVGVEGALVGREILIASSLSCLVAVLLSLCVLQYRVCLCLVAARLSMPLNYPPSRLADKIRFLISLQVVRANMDSPTVAAATEGGSPFYKIYEIYLVRLDG